MKPKTGFFIFLCFFWIIPEWIYIFFTKSISPVGGYLINKIQNL